MKSCELCTQPARVHCDADAANLCWECDKRVHCANFLVARHSRHLLCRSCQATTPWTAVGSELGHRTMSVCHDCTTFWWRKHHRMRRNGEEEEEEEESEGENNDRDGEDEYEEDGVNQMVPILLSVCTPPPPTASSSNTDGAVSNALCSTPCDGVPPLKRNRDDDIGIDCSSSSTPGLQSTAMSSPESCGYGTGPSRPLKRLTRRF